MRNPQSDQPRPATAARLASPAVLRRLRARAAIRARRASAAAAQGAAILDASPMLDPSHQPRPLRLRPALLLSLALMTLAPLSAARAERSAAVEVAMVTDIAGRVERQPQAVERWSAVGLDEAVALYDAMRTWGASTAELRFVDGTVVMLDEKTRLRISPMLFDPSQAPQEVQLALAAGSAEVRAGSRRLWIDTGDGAPHALEPGGALRIRATGGGGVELGVPSHQTPSDLERGSGLPVEPAPGPDSAGPDRRDPDSRDPDSRPFDPTGIQLDPTEVVDQVIDPVPGGAGVDVRLPVAGGVVVVLPALPGADEMPPDMPRQPGLPDLPTLPEGPVGLLRDLVPGGILTGIDDLPPVPTTGRVRVEVDIRRR